MLWQRNDCALLSQVMITITCNISEMTFVWPVTLLQTSFWWPGNMIIQRPARDTYLNKRRKVIFVHTATTQSVASMQVGSNLFQVHHQHSAKSRAARNIIDSNCTPCSDYWLKAGHTVTSSCNVEFEATASSWREISNISTDCCQAFKPFAIHCNFTLKCIFEHLWDL